MLHQDGCVRPGREFLAAAAPGDLSPVLPVSSGGPAEYMLLYRFESRTEATEAVPFGGLELQRSLQFNRRGGNVLPATGVEELRRNSPIRP